MPTSGTPLRSLFVEDTEDDVTLVVRELRRGGYDPAWRRVDSAEALAAALDEPWDVVLCDHSIPGFGWEPALAMVKARGLDLPFILLSGTIGEEAAVEALHAGVQDFVLKDRLARLVPAIQRELTEAANRAQLRKAESLLLRSEKLRALGQMAAGIAHDFKNLLNPLGLHLELVDRALKKAGATRPESIVMMRDIIQRGVETIDRLRAFSALEPETLAEYIDVAQLAREAIELIRPRLVEHVGLILRDDLQPTPPVRGHAADVIAALVNLLGNAIDACGARGVVAIHCGGDDAGVWVEVSDDGPGMTPEVEARVFEPFFSTKGAQGTGLGLANVFAMVRRHGGDIELTTAPGQGARFKVRFRR